SAASPRCSRRSREPRRSDPPPPRVPARARSARAQRRRPGRGARGTNGNAGGAPADGRRGGRVTEGAEVEAPQTVKRRVLIVDDEPGVRESLRMVLKGEYETVVAGSGPEALDALGRAPVDVVLLDIIMPGMEG